ncbi:MAG: MBL fold metallo-hydrolase [Bacteroides sp.]|jgi:L-ascorbate metabolism protein UlaG (beta-lactamase superfamily)|nr:MBL fold metallo-hydrolase [Bacteroides sp.]
MMTPPPPVQEVAMAQSFDVDTFKTRDGKTLEITFIKHGSLILGYDGKNIYVDPVSLYADYSKLPKADVILITHEHADHLDPKAVAEVEKKGTRIFISESAQKKLGKGQVVKNGDELQPLSWMHIKAVPAYNLTPDRTMFHPKGRDNGYLLTLGGTRIYIAGDTEDIPEMSYLGKVDIAFIPVNQPYTMTIKQAVHAAEMIKPHVLYPYHYGDTDIKQYPEKLKAYPDIEVRIRQMQ